MEANVLAVVLVDGVEEAEGVLDAIPSHTVAAAASRGAWGHHLEVAGGQSHLYYYSRYHSSEEGGEAYRVLPVRVVHGCCCDLVAAVGRLVRLMGQEGHPHPLQGVQAHPSVESIAVLRLPSQFLHWLDTEAGLVYPIDLVGTALERYHPTFSINTSGRRARGYKQPVCLPAVYGRIWVLL